MRYVLGPSQSDVLLTTSRPAPAPEEPGATFLIDLLPTIDGVNEDGCTLFLPPYNPATHQPPAEYKVYLAPLTPNQAPAFPSDVDGWLASPHPVSTLDHAGNPDGDKITVPLPAHEADTHYFLQTVIGYRS
jgi:hypothetical protein